MTGYDLFALIVLVLSAGAGFMRGGVREVVTLFAFTLSALVALIALPLTGPLGRRFVDPEWAGSIAAVLVVFLVVYFGIRIVGSLLTRRLRDHARLGGVDRGFGVAIGLVRALILLGVVHLVIAAATPPERQPGWFAGAAIHPVGAAAARAIQAILPNIGRGVDRLSPVVASSVRDGLADGPAPDDPAADPALPQPQSDTTSPADP